MASLSPQEIKELKTIKFDLEDDFYYFCRYFFKAREGVKFMQNWHHEEIARTMQDIAAYRVGNTVINIPPRYTKTEMVVIMFIAWSIAKNPRAKFIHLSYSDDLALDNSGKVKELIESEEFQKFWPIELKADSKSKKKWYTEQGGGMYAGAAGGAVRGFGAGSVEDGPGKLFGGAIIIDDPLKGGSLMIPPRELELVNGRLNTTLSNRRNNHKYTPIIIIMQRLHVDDMAGFVLKNGMNEKFHHVNLPALYLKDGAETALWPAKHTVEQLKAMQQADKYVFASQYLQQPVPLGGAMFKRDWLKFYRPDDKRSWSNHNPYILVDPAAAKTKRSDYTAMMVILLGSDRNYFIGDIVRDRLNPTERIQKLMELDRIWTDKTGKKPRIGYEHYGRDNDDFYINEAQRQVGYYMNIVKLGGKQSKPDRISSIQPLFESGRIYLPQWLMYTDVENNQRDLIKEFVEEEYLLYSWNNTAPHDDMLDALARIADPEMKAVFPMAAPNAYKGHVYKPNNGGTKQSWLNA